MRRVFLSLGLFLALCLRCAGADGGFVERERVMIGGVPQYLVIRGESRTQPVLLFLHGGPGFSQRPFAHANADLERDFIVVHWDQRGTAASYLDGKVRRDAMRIAQFVADTEEVARYLRRKFAQQKIYLVGHSWGSMIGLLSAARSPELYRAYIGISQVINVPESERVLHFRALGQARDQGRNDIVRELQRIGPPPYRSIKDERRVNQIGKQLRAPLPHGMNNRRWISLALTAPDFSIFETVNLARGIRFSGWALRDEIYATDLTRMVRLVRVPVYFLAGRHDTVISPEPTRRYFAKLRAPAGKHFLWFEKSGHWPHLEERTKYAALLRDIKHRLEKTSRIPAT